MKNQSDPNGRRFNTHSNNAAAPTAARKEHYMYVQTNVSEPGVLGHIRARGLKSYERKCTGMGGGGASAQIFVERRANMHHISHRVHHSNARSEWEATYSESNPKNVRRSALEGSDKAYCARTHLQPQLLNAQYPAFIHTSSETFASFWLGRVAKSRGPMHLPHGGTHPAGAVEPSLSRIRRLQRGKSTRPRECGHASHKTRNPRPACYHHVSTEFGSSKVACIPDEHYAGFVSGPMPP